MTIWQHGLISVFLLISSLASAADFENGKDLHDKHCMRCHQPDIYTREKRMVNSYAELQEQVRQCEIMAELAWFDEEIEDVVAYLNEAFYRFDLSK